PGCRGRPAGPRPVPRPGRSRACFTSGPVLSLPPGRGRSPFDDVVERQLRFGHPPREIGPLAGAGGAGAGGTATAGRTAVGTGVTPSRPGPRARRRRGR